ncbi:SRPBCC family protein [Paracoccus sp. (in: a-proteobacteria)]|uniref:SRPBCC family protein n=1 Tax=Paracoccus sp. TaxID=267 RepID=UPI0032209CF8
MANTVHLHRVIAAGADKLYRAFIEADAIASWLPPFGFTCTVHEMEPKVGGHHRMSFRNFTTGKTHAFGGTYLELVPGRRLVYTDRFDDPHLPGEMTVTVDLAPVSLGTDLRIEQRGIPEQIPLEACHLGWQESLRKLARLVEPEIHDYDARG